MENRQMGESDSSRESESEGLSGIDVREDEVHGGLRIDGMASNFVDGNGTRQEPLEPRAGNDIEISLKDANYLSFLLEANYNLKRTIFVRHGGRLLGVDASAHVQLVKEEGYP